MPHLSFCAINPTCSETTKGCARPIILFLVLVGTAAGLLATRLMRIDADLPTPIVLGIAGAGLGWLALRFVLALSGWLLLAIAATLGATGLIWLWQQRSR